ncbi:hypothetical protein B0920_14685 [Massilia sp. KIM]|nr:hypothetical protein B0920_14685 [Massilia sp. KIM]
MTTTPETQGGPPATSKDRLYAIRQPKRAFRHQQKLALDTLTSEALIKVQHLDELKTGRNVFSRTVLIRRAVSLYLERMIEAARSGSEAFLTRERTALLEMSSPPKASLANLRGYKPRSNSDNTK